MNIFDNDFPEVTEAYHGSLEDWQELFERYAFPVGKETDTSKEMKRYLKHNPEATYEDWLDIVIKFVRDELWYEEKINLSIRELYLAVNKVASLGKKLRTTYNKLIAVNDSIALAEDATFKVSTDVKDNPPESYAFDNVVTELKALDLSQELTQEAIQYWSGLRTLMLGKSLSMGRTTSNYWYTRFLSFYKSYIAERFIKKTLASSYTFGLSDIDFTDRSAHHLMQPDSVLYTDDNKGKELFDLTATMDGKTIKIECKTFDTPSSTHRADFVVRYNITSANCIQWVLIGHLDTVLKYLTPIFNFDKEETEILDQYSEQQSLDITTATDYHKMQRSVKDIIYKRKKPIYILADSMKLTSVMKSANISNKAESNTLPQLAELATLKTKFEKLDALLGSSSDEFATILIDKQTQQIAKNIKKIDKTGDVDTGNPDNPDIDSAAADLQVMANNFVAAVTKKATEDNVDKNS